MSRGICRAVAVSLSVAVTLIGVGCGASTSSSSSGGSSKSAAKKPGGCGIKATSDCTPHAGPHGTVIVDTLQWRVVNAKKTKTLGDASLGLGATANGEFVVVKLKVTNHKSESVDLTSDVVKLESNGKTYDPDSSGTTAAIGAGDKPLFLETLGPDVTLTSEVVFDVPPSVATGSPEARFGELGFGDTKGYIALPRMK